MIKFLFNELFHFTCESVFSFFINWSSMIRTIAKNFKDKDAKNHFNLYPN